MKTHLSIACLISIAGLAACDRMDSSSTRTTTTTPSTTPSTTTPSPSTPPKADNTDRNTADRNSTTKTPLDQSNTEVATRITADIRKAIMDDKGMSTNAQNCKIITDAAGVVTLRGPVASQAEKDAIAAKARAVAGVTNVVNELEVKQ